MIINPFYLYLIDTADGLKRAAMVMVIIFGLAAFISLVTVAWAELESTKRKAGVWCQSCILFCLISLLLAIVLPSQETSYKMMVASVATVENLEHAGDTIENSMTWIIDTVDEAIEKFSEDDSAQSEE